jgi:hypothetical protein
MAPERLRRADSFLGIHFDFHAGEDCKEIGRNVTPQMIQTVLDLVKPDYVQCDCKGHAGVSSYPTRVGPPAPGFVRDQLRIWRDVTSRAGVGLYLHYSGVWDSDWVRRSPEHAVVRGQVKDRGRAHDRIASFFGPYVDTLLIPQLIEIRDGYGVDGMWVDGECWAVEPDYCEAAIAAFRARTGTRDIPRAPGEPHYREYVEFTREQFRRYLRHYVDELHRHDRGFQIASNWAFTSQMPEPVSADVDYLSGDYSPRDAVNSARFEGRCLQRQGKPWDLMAWSFSGSFSEGAWTTKTPVQLEQEAAAVLALGGGFQAYFQQRRDGSVSLWQMKLMAEVAGFCRERQAFCHRAEPVPQIALLYAGLSMYEACSKAFGGWDAEALRGLKGILTMLLESQCVVEICMEHHLRGRMAEYPLIVVPEWETLESAFRDELSAYAEGGGSLLVIGARTVSLFRTELDIEVQGDVQGLDKRYLEHEGWLGVLLTRFQTAKLGPRAQAFGLTHAQNEYPPAPGDPAGQVAAVVSRHGKGTIAGVLFDMGAFALKGGNSVCRRFLASLVDRLFPDPLVRVSGSCYVDVTLARKDGKLCANLLNTAGPHSDPEVFVFDEVPRVGPLQVRVRVPARPRSVALEPGGRKVAWKWESGAVTLTLDRLDIHDILVIE